MASKSDDKSTKEKYSIDWKTHKFATPKKEISSPEDIANKWQKSEAYQDIMGFITALNTQLKGKKMRDDLVISDTCKKILQLLDILNKWIDEIPPCEQPQRFGNKAFRDWFDRLSKESETLLKNALPKKFHPAVKEISVYLVESVGNKTRIDYGTGHEFAFVAFLCCLFKIEALQQQDSVAVVLKVFQRYLELMRRLQTTYRMEPAGSHGVFSLDDYHFMPFLWGSAQLIDHPRIKPSQFVEPDYYTSFDKDFMFLSAIRYITQVKTGVFAEHSNQLWNISGVPFWSKVNTGLIKMYKVEVLGKFPVIQHFLFGSLLSIQPCIGPLKHTPGGSVANPGPNTAAPPLPEGPYKHVDTPFPDDQPTSDVAGSKTHRDSPFPDPENLSNHAMRPVSSRHGVKPPSTQDIREDEVGPGKAKPRGPNLPIPAPSPFSGVDPTLINSPGALRNPVMDPTVAKALKNTLPPVPKHDDEALKKKVDGTMPKKTEWSAQPTPDKRAATLTPLDKKDPPRPSKS